MSSKAEYDNPYTCSFYKNSILFSQNAKIQISCLCTNFMDFLIFFFPALKTLNLWLLGWIHTFKSNLSMARIY